MTKERSCSKTTLIPAMDAFESIGVGRTRAYQILNAGTVPAVKVGQSTMIRAEEWATYINSLPPYRKTSARKTA